MENLLRKLLLFFKKTPLDVGSGSTVHRILLLFAGVVIIGLPVNTPVKLAMLMVYGLLVIYSDLRSSVLGYLVLIFCTILSLYVIDIIPVTRIEEGHNLFLPSDLASHATRLPPPVYRTAEKLFDQTYPPAHRCSAKKEGCGSSALMPVDLFASSADAIYQAPRYTRVVGDIDWDDILSFRGGFINERLFKAERLTRLDRINPPFYVMYELSEQLSGSQLCWQGHLFWEQENDLFSHLNNQQLECRQIADGDKGRRVFGLAIAEDSSLTLKLQKSPGRLLWDVMYYLLISSLLGVVAVFNLRPVLNRGLAAAAGLLIAGGITVLTVSREFMAMAVFSWGDDGLTHESFGRVMLEHLLQGNWGEALKGVEKVYYFMPGLRYFRTMEHLVFGDTFYGYLLVTLAIVFALFYLVRNLCDNLTAWLLTLSFLCLPMLAPVGFWFKDYVHFAHVGLAEPLGYCLFLTAMAILLNERHGSSSRWMLLAGVSLALATFVRPNLVLASTAVALLKGIGLVRRGQKRASLCLLIGLSTLGLIPLHNSIYGDQFVLLTSAGTHPANFLTPPGLYLEAMKELFSSGSPQGQQALGHVKHHLGAWLGVQVEGEWLWPWWGIKYPVYIPALRIVSILSLGIVMIGGVCGKLDSRACLLAFAAAMMHLPLLLTHPDYRYAYLAWLCSMVLLVYLLQRAWGLWRQARAVEPGTG